MSETRRKKVADESIKTQKGRVGNDLTLYFHILISNHTTAFYYFIR